MMSRYAVFTKLALLIFLAKGVWGSPTQYYAQIYTEILGRSPTPAEWVANEWMFTQDTISTQHVETMIVSFLQSSEFNGLGYGDAEKAYILFRGILLREPNANDLQSFTNQLQSGVPIVSLARSLLNSQEFSQLLSQRIRPLHSHGFGIAGPAERASIGSVGIGNVDGDELQEALNAAAPGETVFLARGALVRIHEMLIIPEGVTLTTHEPASEDLAYRNRQAYAAMGRLVRTNVFNGEMVRLMPGASLIGVWVDGRRSQIRNNDPRLKDLTLSYDDRRIGTPNVLVRGNTSGENQSEVEFCKLSDSSGWTALHCVGQDGGTTIGFSRVANNLITSYSASRDLEESFFTDGISNASSDATILNNEIVDPSDVGVVIFNPGLDVRQNSQVAFNSILFAGVNAWGGITLDHSVGIRENCMRINPEGIHDCFDPGNPAIVADFSTTLIMENTIWGSDYNYANIGISAGVHMWGLRMFGEGSQILRNEIGLSIQPLNTGVGIVVSGMKEPVVLENVLHVELDQSIVSCYSTELLLDPTRTTLGNGGQIQPGFVTGEVWASLRAKSNGFLFGRHHLLSANDRQKGIIFDVPTTDLVVQNVSSVGVADDWIVVSSERDFGDGERYYIIVNRGSHQVIRSEENGVGLAPYGGTENEYWKFESFDGNTPGNGLRLVNRVTGQNLGRSADGSVFSSNNPFEIGVNWLFRRIENREFDLNQSELSFVDPFGEVFQIYTEAGRILEDRFLGNPNSDFGIGLFSAENTSAKPLGKLDLDRNGTLDLSFILSDGSLFVGFQSAEGVVNGANIGNMRHKWIWDINRTVNSWEKPIGFVNMGGGPTEDIVVVDREGNLEVGVVESTTLGDTRELGRAAAIGLEGLNSTVNSEIKSLGSGDFDGDGDLELLFVNALGELYRVDVANLNLQQAVMVGNPLESFGWGVTSSVESSFRPVGITDVSNDGVDDVVLLDPQGFLYAYLMRNGELSSGAEIGNPSKSWDWNLSSGSRYTRPLGVAFGNGWWTW